MTRDEELRSLGLGAGLPASPPRVPVGKKFMLGIGIDKYEGRGGYASLKYPVQDVENFSKILIAEYGFEESNTLIIKNEMCTQKEIQKTIVELKKKLNVKHDQLLVFFAGHGAVDGENGYWVPSDAEEITELNLSVDDILRKLIGCCKQVLLVVDCCFSGMATEKAYPRVVFAPLSISNSKFSVITSSNKSQVVPDKSEFMENLLDILSTKNISNLEELVGDLNIALEGKGTRATPFSSSDQEGTAFILQRKDKVSFELTNSFFELNYTEQSKRIKGTRLNNLIYVRGTKECGHHIFTQRFFRENGATRINMFNYRPELISFGRDSQSENYSIWNSLAKLFGCLPEANQVMKKIFLELEFRNWVLIIKVDGCENSELEKALVDFWKNADNFIANNADQNSLQQLKNKMFTFIWDRRGDSEDIIDENIWGQSQNAIFCKLLHLPTIRELDVNNDLLDWYNDVKDNNGYLKRKKFETSNLLK